MSALAVSQRTIVLLLVAVFAALTTLTMVSALTDDGGAGRNTVEARKQMVAPSITKAW